jgi:hypothetical protein
MALVINDIISEDFQDFDPSEEKLSEIISGSGGYRTQSNPNLWTSYKKETIPNFDSKYIQEKIAFLIDCYSIFYEKLGNIEERLETIEKKNSEILLLLSKGQDSTMTCSIDCIVDISADQMKEKIIEYYRNHPIVYPSDIANEMNFDLKDVVKIIKELIASGQVEEVT